MGWQESGGVVSSGGSEREAVNGSGITFPA